MILFIISVVLFLALVVVAFLQIKNKLIILAACVTLLILCNFINEIRVANRNAPVRVQYGQKQSEEIVSALVAAQVNVLTNETVQQKNGDLLQEQREMSNYLFKRWESNEHFLVNFQNLHKNRLKVILEVVNYRVNNTNSKRNVEFYYIDYKQQRCTGKCLRKTVQTVKNNEGFIVFVVDNIKKTEELRSLKQIYLDQSISVIFLTLPRFFQLHTISHLTYRFPFSNNYLPKLLEHHPSKTIEYCSLYRSFDYQFYAASLTTPLLQLCTRSLPSTAASKCVKKYITEQKMRVPQNLVRKCLQQQNLQGLIFDNGWVSLKREYFWSGKANKTDLIPPKEQL